MCSILVVLRTLNLVLMNALHVHEIILVNRLQAAIPNRHRLPLLVVTGKKYSKLEGPCHGLPGGRKCAEVRVGILKRRSAPDQTS